MANITIIGGHGKVALLAEPMLVEQGHTVNAIIRKPEQSADIMTTGANPVVADIEQMSTEEMAKLFADLNTDILIWSAGAGGAGGPERTIAVDREAAIRSMDAAKAAGITRYLMVSFLGAGQPHRYGELGEGFNVYVESKIAADDYLRDSGLDYTLVGPGGLTLDDETGIELGLHLNDLPLSQTATSRATVARVITAAMADESTIGKALPFINGSTPVADALAQAPADSRLLP